MDLNLRFGGPDRLRHRQARPRVQARRIDDDDLRVAELLTILSAATLRALSEPVTTPLISLPEHHVFLAHSIADPTR